MAKPLPLTGKRKGYRKGFDDLSENDYVACTPNPKRQVLHVTTCPFSAKQTSFVTDPNECSSDRRRGDHSETPLNTVDETPLEALFMFINFIIFII